MPPLVTRKLLGGGGGSSGALAATCANLCAAFLPEWMATKKMYTLAILLLTTMVMFADQNLMSPNLSEIAKDFGIPEDQKDARLGGDVAIAFFVVGAPFAIVAGWYTDRLPRNKMFGGVALVGAHGCLFTYFVTTQNQLLLARAITGLSIGGAAPILFSILSDLYPAHQRNLVVAVVGFAMALGGMLGQSVSGGMAQAGRGWREPFLVVSMPAFALGLIVYFTVEDPVRASQELVSAGGQASDKEGSSQSGKQAPAEYTERATLGKVGDLFRVKTNILLFLQGIPGCVPWGVISTFMNDYLSSERGATIAQATTVVVLWSVGDFMGTGIGGLVGQRLYNTSKRTVCWFMGGTTIAGVLPLVYMLNAPFHMHTFCVVSFLGGLVASMTGGNVKAVLMNVNIPEMRGVANGVFNLTDGLGQGLGPAVIAMLEAAAGGRRQAFTISALAWVLCGLFLLGIGFTCEEDEKLVHTHVQKYNATASDKAEMVFEERLELLRSQRESNQHDMRMSPAMDLPEDMHRHSYSLEEDPYNDPLDETYDGEVAWGPGMATPARKQAL